MKNSVWHRDVIKEHIQRHLNEGVASYPLTITAPITHTTATQLGAAQTLRRWWRSMKQQQMTFTQGHWCCHSCTSITLYTVFTSVFTVSVSTFWNNSILKLYVLYHILTSIFCMLVTLQPHAAVSIPEGGKLETNHLYKKTSVSPLRTDTRQQAKWQSGVTQILLSNHTNSLNVKHPILMQFKMQLKSHCSSTVGTVPLFETSNRSFFFFSFRQTSSMTLNQLPKHIHYTT